MPVILRVGRWGLASLILGFASAALAAATNSAWISRAWQSDEGLPDNTVMGIDQTPDGFLWVATSTGLVRFDGVQFRQFPVTAPGAPAGRLKALVADRRNRVWVAKDQGVVICLEQGRSTMVVGPEHAASDGPYRGMVEDAEGAVWVSYAGGEVLRIQDGQVRSLTPADGLPEGGFCHLVKDGAGRLWFSKGEWVGVFREGKFHKLWQTPVQIITGAYAGGAWAYADGQVWKHTEGGPPVKLGSLAKDASEVGVVSLREDRAGCLWLGTIGKGLFRFDQKGLVTEVLPQQTILTLKEDREGSLWVGIRGGGLNQLRPRVVDLLTTGSASPFQGVRSVCQDAEGLLWAVVWPNGGIVRSAGQGWTLLSANDGWSLPDAQCLAADAQGGVWIGTTGSGLYRWQRGAVTDSLGFSNGLGGNWISALLATASGEIWIGTGGPDSQHEVLQRRKAGQLRTFHLPPGSGPVVALATDSAGDCWAATSKGLLLRVRADVLTDESGSALAEPHEIRCLLGTPDGSLWIGCGGQGLGRLKDGRFSRCRMDQGLHDDYISNMLPDGHGRLWFAGNRGIFSVRQKDLGDFAEGRAARVWSAAYGRSDGLLMLQASCDSWPGALRTTDGRLHFAMQSGVAVVYADNFKETPEPPLAVIERVTANGQTVAAYGAGGLPVVRPASAPLELCQDGAHLRLSPGQRRVEFTFTALTFQKPESIGFRHRLRGLDANWVEAGTRRVATYVQLLPGHYQFEVTACSSDGVWNKTAAALEVTAEPLWWETVWFRVTSPLCAVGLLVGGIILGLRRRHRREIERLELLQATDRERARIARDMHDEIGSRLARLSVIGEMAVGTLSDNPAARPQVQEMARGVREAAGELEHIIWSTNPVHDTLAGLAHRICQEAEEFLADTPVQCRFETLPAIPDQPMRPDARAAVLKAVKAALANVLKHAAATTVNINLGVDEGEFQVRIADDGCGFDPAQPSAAGGGNGLANMRERLAGLGGECRIESAPGRGTTVVLCWPLDKTRGSASLSTASKHEPPHIHR